MRVRTTIKGQPKSIPVLLVLGIIQFACSGDLYPVKESNSEVIDQSPEPLEGSDAGTETELTYYTTDPFEACVERSETAAMERGPADVVIVVDNSASMRIEAQLVQANINRLSNIITAYGVDAQVLLISATYPEDDEGICVAAPLGSGSCPDDTNPDENYLHIPESVNSSESLDVIMDCHPGCRIDSVEYTWNDWVRVGSTVHFVVVSDDNSNYVPSSEFTEWAAENLDNNYIFHAIVSNTNGSGDNITPECDKYAAKEGIVYKELVAQTGGVLGDLCLQDSDEFDRVFEQLADQVRITSMACEWTIPEAPMGQGLDPDKVNVVFRDTSDTNHVIGRVESATACTKIKDNGNGWYYDNPDAPTKVLSCPQTCEWLQGDLNGRITVKFGCTTTYAVVII
jgi:hypothetical protein